MHRQIAGRLTGPVTKWVVLALWLLIAAGASVYAGKLISAQDNQASSWLPASAESTRALGEIARFRDQDDLPTTLVYHRADGLRPADLMQITDAVARVQRLDHARPTTTPQGQPVPPQALVRVSEDRKVAEATVVFNFGGHAFDELPAAADQIRSIAKVPGTTFHLTGQGGQAADQAEAFSGLDSTLLLATVLVVIVVLLFTYRSPVLWLLPLLSAGAALVTAQGVIYLLVEHAGLTVNGQSYGILTVLVFGAGTDYALLLVARYREELRRHEDRHEAMAFALHRAAPAIVASGMTVILGMLCLLAAEMNSTAGLGPVAAVGIAVCLLVMLTLLPALLVITGRWIFWPTRPGFGSPEPTTTGFWARVGGRIRARPRAVWAGTAIILAVACLGLVRLDANGLSTADSYTTSLDSVVGQQVLTRHGLNDNASPVLVVANASHARQVHAAVAGVSGVGPPSPPAVEQGVAFVSAPLPGDPTGVAATHAVERVRAAVHAIPGAHALVGGTTAINADIQQASSRDDRVIIPLVLLVVLLILMVLLRAVLSPLLLIGTVVLSFGAALGISALLFHYVFGFAGADPAVPLFVFVFLVALGIDYNIFLMTRVREETHLRGTRDGSLVALGATGGVITSAGLVLAATFAVLTTMPLVAFAEVGIAVALGVLLDTLVVRSILVTALNLDFGGRIWWPSRLDRGAHAVRAATSTTSGAAES